MILNLRDIPHDGESFSWTHQDTDLKNALFDLTKDHPITLTIRLMPLEQGADLRGEISTFLTLPCSFCASEIPVKVIEKFHEIILIGKKDKLNPEGETKLYINSDNTEFQISETPNFNLGNLLREIILSNTPIQPKCIEKGGSPDVSPHCLADWDYQKYTQETAIKSSPFDILKNLKAKKN